jgi:hypothetical protein
MMKIGGHKKEGRSIGLDLPLAMRPYTIQG